MHPDLWAPVPDIMDALRRTAEDMGDEVFATWIEAGGKETRHWSFRDTWEAAGAVAHALVHDWGVQPGDRVMLCYNFSFEYFPAFLGCLRAGAVACPVYPIDPGKMEIALKKFKLVVEDTGARLVLTDNLINWIRIGCGLFYSHLMPKGLEWRVTDQLVQRPPSSHPLPPPSYDYPDRAPSDIAFLQYTSGSTGDPKGVMITYANLGANVGLIAGAQRFAFSYADLIPVMHVNGDRSWFRRSRSVSWLPMYHDMGLVYGVVAPFFMGARMHYLSPITFLKDPCLWIRLLAKKKATWAAGPDFAYRLCSKKWDAKKWPVDEYSLTHIIYMHTGAEPIQSTTLVDFNRVFRPYRLHARALSPCYGLAESVVCVSWFDPVANPPGSLIAGGDKPGYVCCAADFRVDLRIVDPDTCEEMQDGTAGELWVSGPSVALGYWNQPALTKTAFRARLSRAAPLEARPWARFGNGEYLRTGDVAFMQDGRLYFSGRLKDMMIIHGKRYYAQDIEFPAQDAWSAVRGGCIAAFSMLAEGKDEEELHLVFEVAPARYSQHAFREHVNEVVQAVRKKTGLTVFRAIAVRDRTIPKTTSGKIRRRATKEALRTGHLWVLYDSLCLLSPGKGRGATTLERAETVCAASLPRSYRPLLKRSTSMGYLSSMAESIGEIWDCLFNALAEHVGAYVGLDTELIMGSLRRNISGSSEQLDEKRKGEGKDGAVRKQDGSGMIDNEPSSKDRMVRCGPTGAGEIVVPTSPCHLPSGSFTSSWQEQEYCKAAKLSEKGPVDRPEPCKQVTYLPFPALSLVSSWINGAASDLRKEQPLWANGRWKLAAASEVKAG